MLILKILSLLGLKWHFSETLANMINLDKILTKMTQLDMIRNYRYLISNNKMLKKLKRKRKKKKNSTKLVLLN